MSTKTQALLEEIKALSLKERHEILESLRETGDRAEKHDESIRHGRGLFAGTGLLKALLDERSKERARG